MLGFQLITSNLKIIQNPLKGSHIKCNCFSRIVYSVKVIGGQSIAQTNMGCGAPRLQKGQISMFNIILYCTHGSYKGLNEELP